VSTALSIAIVPATYRAYICSMVMCEDGDMLAQSVLDARGHDAGVNNADRLVDRLVKNLASVVRSTNDCSEE
jgi:hypothetical protein